MTAAPHERLLAHIERGTLVREDGYETACFLTTMAPDFAASRLDVCPADVMPAWLAELTPLMDDRGSARAWHAMAQRYASVAPRWHVLDADAWERCETAARVGAIAEMRRHAGDAERSAALDSAAEWLARGDAANADALESVEDWLACRSSASECRAVRAAITPGTPWEATEAAASVVREAALDSGASSPVQLAAERAAWDRMTSEILAAIERECDAAEGAQ